MSPQNLALPIKMILMDVDGTLTDGTLAVLPDGEEIKSYHVRDGMGIMLAHLAGLKTGIITGKTSRALQHRAERLRITEIHQGVLNKKEVFMGILERHRLAAHEVAFIGDDLGDLPVIKLVGLAAAVADAHPLIIQHCQFVCRQAGGRGAVREFLEFIFQAQDLWPQIEAKMGDLTGVKI
jgi:3-deoxy-D-manno-octulosonate 8-phosphate phosphatase (KDO 8-P phosphatase)